MNKVRVMLMPSPPDSGSIGSTTKMLGVAKALEKRNAEVCFVIGGQLGEFYVARGYKVYPYPVPKTAGTDIDVENIVDFLEWTGLCEKNFVKQSVEAELEAIKDFCPTVIFAEARPSASISARAAGVKLATIASWSCSPDNPVNKSMAGRSVEYYNEELKRYGLPLIHNVAELFFKYSDIKLAPTLPVLEPEISKEENVRFTGYILDDKKDDQFNMEWYKEMNKENLIFIYLSVGALQPKLYMDTIIKTFKDTKYNVVCGCGFHFALEDIPKGLSNIQFMKYVPLRNIIEDASLVIFHGGQDTMLTTLLYGVPSITFPGKHFERDYNSEKIDELKLSKKMSIWSFRPKRLIEIVDEMVQPAQKARCEEFKKVFSDYDGTESCASILYEA